MKKLTLALASTAIAAAASSMLVSTAEAGRGGGHRFHFGFHRFHHFHTPPRHVYRDEEEYYVRRRKPKVVIKEVVKYVPAKPTSAAKATPVAAVKYADGQGREFDATSNVWFDGKNQCWKGDKAFAFRSGSWFYGNARWVETSSGWGVSSGVLPQQVTCAGIQAFSGKIQQADAAPAEPKAAAAPKATASAPAQVATAPQPAPVAEAPAANTPAAPANARECKKYFPSVGEMVSVPCTE